MNPQSSHCQRLIAFYNTENLFHYSQESSVTHKELKLWLKSWTKERYDRKINNIGLALSKITLPEQNQPPSIIGLAELGSPLVLQDLIASDYLKAYNYDYIFFDSPDDRGMSVGILYSKNVFKLENAEPVFVSVDASVKDVKNTRDILVVRGQLDGEAITFLVNHWPSRHQKSDPSGFKRHIAAEQNKLIIKKELQKNREAKIIVMGDFNDSPMNDSLQYLVNETGIINPMVPLVSYHRGSVNHRSKWALFDQILVSPNFRDRENSGFQLVEADIFDPEFLTRSFKKSRHLPYRTFENNKYQGGFSDHFPVYIQIEK